MGPNIKESDWKIFRELQPVALDRFCQRVLAEVETLISAGNQTNHERYLAMFKLLKRRDDELANMFNDFRRSTAVQQIARIQHYGLWTKEELARFSDETRNTVEGLLGLWGS